MYIDGTEDTTTVILNQTPARFLSLAKGSQAGRRREPGTGIGTEPCERDSR